MKRFFAFLFFFSIVFASAQTFKIPETPRKQTSVYDFVGLLQPHHTKALEHKLLRYADSTSTQIVVIIIPTTKGEYIGTLAPRWAHKWGIGQSKEDNGVLVLVAHHDRKIGISPGYGLEHKLTAGVSGEIIRNIMIPEFKTGNYYFGLNNGIDAIIQLFAGTYKAKEKPKGKAKEEPFPYDAIIFIIVVFVILIFLSKRNNGGGNRTGTFKSDPFEAIILSGMGRSTGSFGSSGSSGESSGGFGGFGGGFGGGGFSGGGATGSW